MEDIEGENTSLLNTNGYTNESDESTTPMIINKNVLFHVSAICGLLLYVGTNLYCSIVSFIANYQLFIWHPVLMSYMILFSTPGKSELLSR